MNTRNPASPAAEDAAPRPGKSEQDLARDVAGKQDQELDQELNDTFPASDPLPWSHEVK
jgi:hypothetical protein